MDCLRPLVSRDATLCAAAPAAARASQQPRYLRADVSRSAPAAGRAGRCVSDPEHLRPGGGAAAGRLRDISHARGAAPGPDIFGGFVHP
jgi:hypothetical protein